VKRVGVDRLRRQLATLIEEGEPIIVTRYGRAVAILVPSSGVKNVTFGDLLRRVEWHDVERELRRREESDDQISGYRRVFDHLHELQAEPSRMRIVLERDRPGTTEGEDSTEVLGRNGQLNRDADDFENFRDHVDEEWANAETGWALSLTPWEEWLGMQIDSETLDTFAPPAIVAHCLWEMTFHGFTQEKIEAFELELKQECDRLDAMTDEEREKETISVDELWRQIDEDAEKG
jgi:antitoxin (DNA-binding transcriptional repressor) of toxin-antitoxin stability system